MARTFLSSRIALAVALSTGLAVTVATPAVAAKKEKAAPGSYSDAFRKAAVPIEKAMTEATAKVPANATPADLAAAKTSMDTALGGNAKAALEAAIPTATTPDDKQALGTFLRNYGIIAQDLATKQKGNELMLQSGKVPAASLGLTNYDAGITAYQLKDYAGAATYLKTAKDAGFVDSANQLDAVLADSFKRSNNPGAILQMSKDDIAAAKAKGVAPSETSLRNALQAVYDSKQVGPSVEYAAMLGQYYPATWNTAISVVRQVAALPRDQNVDLMRLMFATGSLANRGDYVEYLDNLDSRAYPGEALKVINDGIAKGKITAADVGEDKSIAAGRVTADKATLPATERDAMKPGATAATVIGAGDLFLSYDEPAKAETFYGKALTIAGADTAKAALRMGIAQVQQGKFADAQVSFAKVTGPRVSVAKMWAAYAASKAGGAAPAAPAAAS